MSITFSQIKAQVAAVRRKYTDSRAVAIKVAGRWTDEPHQKDGDEQYLIRYCESPLAMRCALREGPADVTRVLLTNLDERDIGADVLVRLKPDRVIVLNNWEIVKSLFQARMIDPRLSQNNWLASMLMDLSAGGFPVAAGGFLDAETVWDILLQRQLNFDVNRPDLHAILKWSTDADNVARFRRSGKEFQAATIDWLNRQCGPAAQAVLECVLRSELPETLPIGLAAQVVFHPDSGSKLERSAIRMEERFFNRQRPTPELLQTWSAAATDVVRMQFGPSRIKRQLLERADQILKELEADKFCYLSDTSPEGFDQRMARFGKALKSTLTSAKITSTEHLVELRDDLHQHDQRETETRRLQRVNMALRLVQWLMTPVAETRSLADAARYHLLEGGFVDWARYCLRAPDPVRQLAEACRALFEKVSVRQMQQSHTFAQKLAGWIKEDGLTTDIIPVEQVLDRIVTPLAKQFPVLVIVLDGMSVAVFHELMSDFPSHEWQMLSPSDTGLLPGLATVPSITNASRTSLLSGKLQVGGQTEESNGFRDHPGLKDASRGKAAPRLFHKGELQGSEDGTISDIVRQEISTDGPRVVGVVINAIDDHLAKGDQIATVWTRETIHSLPVLLHEARQAGRAVVLLSDHGHVLDCGAKKKTDEESEGRFRADDGQPDEEELQITGKRILCAPKQKLIAPTSEKLRYTQKANGYHGGLTPQEMVVPVVVLSTTEPWPEGFVEVAIDKPDWWDVSPVAALDDLPELKAQKESRRKAAGRLFDPDDENPSAPTAKSATAPTVAAATWIDLLLASPAFSAQKQIAGRAVPSDADFRKILQAIEDRKGKITSAALARSIGIAPSRLRTTFSLLQRVLNIDGYSIIRRDDSSDSIELDRNSLLRQFGLV